MHLTLKHLTYTYDDAASAALDEVSASIPAGWTGVVGSNGSGKSTLLRIVTGDLIGYQGTVAPTPDPTHAAYCAQATERPPAALEEFAADWSTEAIELRRVLGIDDDWIWRFDTLSHGERKRLQVAVALWCSPHILALDEPTNHVDAPTRERLQAALRNYRGIGLLVSHDRELLDALVGQCLFLRDGQVTMRSGTYTQGREQEALELKTVTRQRKSAKAELGALRREQAARAGDAARADARRSRKHLAIGDSDGRARIGAAIYTGQDGKAGKRSVQMNARLSAAQKRVDGAFVTKTYEGTFWLDTCPAKRRVLVSLPPEQLPLGGERRLCHPELVVENHSHIGLLGPNGAGKSTLVRALVAQLPDDVPALVIAQELDEAAARRVLDDLRSLSPDRRGEVLSLVARLNSDPDRVLAGDNLSPGELRKILLARGVLSSPQLIIMDEPTNHLDVHSIEALEAVLADCPCALVLVSHDAPFLATTTDEQWTLTLDGQLISHR